MFGGQWPCAFGSLPVGDERPHTRMRTRIIGLGNTLLRDDGAGIYAVRELQARIPQSRLQGEVEIIESEVAGFALMELMSGADRVILVDAIQFHDLEPGTVVQIDPGDLRTSLRLRSVHEIDLPTVLALGRRLGLTMPDEILVFGIQAEDALSFGETLTPPVARGMAEAVEGILKNLATS